MKAPRQKVYVIGVGMTKFSKPSKTTDYPQLGLESGAKALLDAGITYDAVEKGYACYAYGDSTSGQRVFYQLGEYPAIVTQQLRTIPKPPANTLRHDGHSNCQC